MSQLFTSGGQSIGASAPSFLSMNIQGGFPLGFIGLISLLSKGLSSLLQDHNWKASILWCSFSHLYMITRKTIALTVQTFVSQVMSLFFNMLSRFIIAFLPRNKHLLIMATVTIFSDSGAQENIIFHCFNFSPIYLP